MNYAKGILVSLILHSLVILVLYAGNINLKQDEKPIRTVDISAFTFEKSVSPELPPAPIPVSKPSVPEPAKPKSKPVETPRKEVSKSVSKAVAEKITEEPKVVSDFGQHELTKTVDENTSEKTAEATGSASFGGVAESAGGSAPSASAGSGGGVTEYYMNVNLAGIRRKISNSLEYPSTARRMGMRGVTEVKFRIYPSGNVDDISVNKPSGHRILDEAAIKAVGNAAPLPKPSETIYVVLAISFSLK